jgi:hypothetical protein
MKYCMLRVRKKKTKITHNITETGMVSGMLASSSLCLNLFILVFLNILKRVNYGKN